MNIYLQTRGTARAAGYRFLGAKPAEAWWRRYRGFTAFEYPTILVESADANEWRVFLSGIPSNRVDATGTTNRFTIVTESADPGGEDAELVVQLVSTWLNDIKNNGTRGDLQHALDEKFTDEDVTRLYGQEGDGARDEVAKKVLQALRDLEIAVKQPESGDPMHGFVDQVRKLLNGKQGAAILVNLTSDDHTFDAVRPKEGSLFVLAVNKDGKLDNELRKLYAKKALRPSPGRPEVPGTPHWSIPKIALAALAVLILVTVWTVLKWTAILK